MVKVSVIIPVYNVENYLKECLDSVVNQTLSDIEIICINDGSTDNSLAILETYKNSDERVKVFSEDNSGQSVARNLGLKNSSGQYIYFIDSDDYIELNMLEELYNNAVSNNSDIVVSKIARFNNESSEIDYTKPGFDFDDKFGDVDYNHFTFNYKDIKPYVLNASFAPWMKLFRKDFLVNNNFYFDEHLVFEDVPFHVKTFLKADKISFAPDFYYYYRYNPSSTVNTASNGFDIFEIVDIVEDYLIDNYYYGEFKDEFDFFKSSQIINYILTTQSEDYFIKAKEEFSKMKLSNNHMLPDYIYDKFNLVLNSDNYFDYIQHQYDSRLTDMKSLQEENLLLHERSVELELELNCISKSNKKLSKENKKLSKENKKYKSKIKKLEKTNKLLLNSTSWKVTAPLRKFTNIFRK